MLARLRVLARLEHPVWLAGGVAVDSHVGRAGRDPGEVSLAYERRLDDNTGALVMLASYDGVEPGIYPGYSKP